MTAQKNYDDILLFMNYFKCVNEVIMILERSLFNPSRSTKDYNVLGGMAQMLIAHHENCIPDGHVPIQTLCFNGNGTTFQTTLSCVTSAFVDPLTMKQMTDVMSVRFRHPQVLIEAMILPSWSSPRVC